MRKYGILTLAILLAVAVSSAQASEFENAEISAVDGVADLATYVEDQTASSGAAQWLAYEVPAIDPESRICCHDLWNQRARDKTCDLEGTRRGTTFHSRHSASGQARYRSSDLLVLMRLEAGDLERIRIYSADCAVDAGGRRVTLLEGVDPGQSARLLHQIAAGEFTRGQTEDVREGALMSLAQHANDYPDAALEQIANGSHSDDLREDAIFWLGEARGRPGYLALERLMSSLDDSELREELAFALSLSEVPEALDTLIEMARSDPDSDSRGKALFWLSQTGGEKAAESIMAAVRDDSSADVREEAIFALSQLPGSEGTDMLIAVARDASFPRETRKEAIFWLGQSSDPRALDLFTEILQ